MATIKGKSSTYFHWNTGGWFGCQFGCTAFLLTGFVEFLWRDPLMSFFCLASFVLLNAWGFYLWNTRENLSVHVAMLRFIAAVTLVITVLIALVNWRGLTTAVPYWIIAFFPGMMLIIYLRERSAQRNQEPPSQR